GDLRIVALVNRSARPGRLEINSRFLAGRSHHVFGILGNRLGDRRFPREQGPRGDVGSKGPKVRCSKFARASSPTICPLRRRGRHAIFATEPLGPGHADLAPALNAPSLEGAEKQMITAISAGRPSRREVHSHGVHTHRNVPVYIPRQVSSRARTGPPSIESGRTPPAVASNRGRQPTCDLLRSPASMLAR